MQLHTWTVMSLGNKWMAGMVLESEYFTEFQANTVLVQACLRAPHVVADKAKLAIVFNYFWPRWLACAMRACVRHA